MDEILKNYHVIPGAVFVFLSNFLDFFAQISCFLNLDLDLNDFFDVNPIPQLGGY